MANESPSNISGRTVRCDNCGTTFPDFEWTPGTLCPKCGSAQFEPVVVIGDNAEYYKADRSGGFALEDIRFGRLAQWADIITPKQFQKALYDQKQLATLGKRVPDLGGMLVRHKLMSRNQVRAVLEARCAVPGNLDDVEFGVQAVRLGYVTEAQMKTCQKLQSEASALGQDPLPFPLLFYEKRFMQENHIVALLRSGHQQGKGLLSKIERAAGKAAPQPERTRAGLLTTKAQLIRVGLAVALPIVMILIWYGVLTGGVETANVRCVKEKGGCGAEGGAPTNSNWPVTCPACGNRAMYPLAICLQCGERFPVTNFTGVGAPIACPKCKSTKFVMITSGIDADAIDAEIQRRKRGAS